MSIPGSNLYRQATKLIRPTMIEYFYFLGREIDAAGRWVNSYSDVNNISASVQAVARNKYNIYGLDLQKYYVRIYLPQDTIDLNRDTSGDRFNWNGDTFQIESDTDWFPMDRWNSAFVPRIVGEIL